MLLLIILCLCFIALILFIPFRALADCIPDLPEYRLRSQAGKTNHIIYVIGHKNPDTDSVCSSIAYAHLLNEIGFHAVAVVPGPLNGESTFIHYKFGLQIPAVLKCAEDHLVVLVDHSTYAQAIDGINQTCIVGIVDHHEGGDISYDGCLCRMEPVGATVSLIYQAYLDCGVPIPEDMAQLMFAALLSDTRNMTWNVTMADMAAYEALRDLSNIDDPDMFYLEMTIALASYDSMSDEEIFLSDYKEYSAAGITFGIADVNVLGEDALRKMADRMIAVMPKMITLFGIDMLFTIINNKKTGTSENAMYMTACGEGATEILQKTYSNFNGNWYFIFKTGLSRKRDIVPAITKTLTEQYQV